MEDTNAEFGHSQSELFLSNCRDLTSGWVEINPERVFWPFTEFGDQWLTGRPEKPRNSSLARSKPSREKNRSQNARV